MKTDKELKMQLWEAKWITLDLPCDTLNSEQLAERFDEMLDNCNEEIRIGSLHYAPSECLKKVDPVAYRLAVSEYIDSEIGETLAWVVDEEIAIAIDEMEMFAAWVLEQDADVIEGFKAQKWCPELQEALKELEGLKMESL